MPKQLLPVILILFWLPSLAQQRILGAGIKLVNDLTLYDGFAPGIGAQITFSARKGGGFESGIYFSTWDHHFISSDGTVITISRIAERHLYVPFLYRYEFKKINITGGAAIDFFLHFREKSKNQSVPIPELTKPGTGVYATLGFSRSIFLSRTISLDPEIRLNYKFLKDDGSLGLNLGLRKLFL